MRFDEHKGTKNKYITFLVSKYQDKLKVTFLKNSEQTVINENVLLCKREKKSIFKIYKEFLLLNSWKTNQFWNGQRIIKDFFQRKYTNGQQTHEMCSTAFIIRGMQMKTIMKCHLISVRMVTIKNRDKCFEVEEKSGLPVHCSCTVVYWCKSVLSSWKIVWGSSKI